MSTILVIDDEDSILEILRDILEDEGYTVFTAADGYEGLACLGSNPVDMVFLDVWLPNMGGIEVLEKIKETEPDIPVVIISGHASIDMAVKAVKMGAFDFLEKPLSLDRVITLANNALAMEELKRENRELKSSLFMEDEIIGKSDEVKRIKDIITHSAPSDARVLITGDNGTGKELVARELHRQSNRASGPFVEVNCAAIPDTLLESELFGHEKGAFTGAVARRKGKFELAHEGTIFLDEVADMSAGAQAKVLRVIQELTFQRIGGEKQIHVDVRIVAATNKDIQEEIRRKRFREDLYYRLNVVPIHVPSLEERKKDLPLLLEYFLKKSAKEKNEKKRSISPQGMELLEKYNWPGNIRELKNFVERITIMSDEEIISRETVEFYLGKQVGDSKPALFEEFGEMKLGEAKDEFERTLLVQKLKEHDFNISRTAENLGIYPSNLHGKIKKYGIEIEK
jgi:two-component system, NtrC family, nitrogen regulation response regulator NtrX